MKRVAIELPSELFVAIYTRFGDATEEVIIGHLQQLASNESDSKASGSSTSTSFRPSEGTITGRVWEIADQLLQAKGQAPRADVVQACINEGINMNTANTQYSHWKKAVMDGK